jgi:hypothetical protein
MISVWIGEMPCRRGRILCPVKIFLCFIESGI